MSKKKAKKTSGVQTLSVASEEALQQTKSLLFVEGEVSPESISECAARLRGIAPEEAHEILRRLAQEGKERALPLLKALLSDAENGHAYAVVEAAGLVPSAESAQLLTEVAAQTTDKQLSKEARRALQRLRASGINVDTFVPRGESILAGVQDVRFQKAYASVMDGAGGRLVLLARRMAQPGLAVARVYYDDQHGIGECGVNILKKQEFLDMVQSSESEPFIWTEVPWDYARHLLNEARQQSAAHGHELPDGYDVVEEILGGAETSYEQPLIYQQVNADEVKEQRHWLDESADLIDAPEFDSWWLERDTSEQYAAKWREAEGSWLVLSEAAQKDREQKIFNDAADEIFDEATRARFKRRLEEMAYILFQRHGERPAKQAVAAALVLAPEGRDPHLNPFIVAMVERSVRSVAKRTEREERQEGRIYVPGRVLSHEPSHEHEHEHEHGHESR